MMRRRMIKRDEIFWQTFENRMFMAKRDGPRVFIFINLEFCNSALNAARRRYWCVWKNLVCLRDVCFFFIRKVELTRKIASSSGALSVVDK